MNIDNNAKTIKGQHKDSDVNDAKLANSPSANDGYGTSSYIPFLGFGGETGIGVLPVLMGVTLFLTMKQTAANLEGQNKIMRYSMNGMFVFLFNSFPAGLNLYYVIYNLLNYLQQRKTSSKK